MNFDWSELAFGSKKTINGLKTVFIVAPRELSTARFTQLVKEYLPKANLVVGISQEPHVLGLEDQPQFSMLKRETIQPTIDKVRASAAKNKIYTFNYSQRDLVYILDKLSFRSVILVNGSWKFPFHTQAPFYALVKKETPYEMVSPFASDDEAKSYAETTKPQTPPKTGSFSEAEMQELADAAAKQSFDNGFQTGVSLGRKKGTKYRLLATAFNKVVPYQTYAMHHGAARETNFSPMHDLNHYDTTHAEVELIIKAQKEKIDFKGTTLFINLLPCPTCARMLSQTDIGEFVYHEDHSDGYAVKMLERAGKNVRRVV